MTQLEKKDIVIKDYESAIDQLNGQITGFKALVKAIVDMASKDNANAEVKLSQRNTQINELKDSLENTTDELKNTISLYDELETRLSARNTQIADLKHITLYLCIEWSQPL